MTSLWRKLDSSVLNISPQFTGGERAVAHSAGSERFFVWLVPGVPLRSTPGFTLSPRFAGLRISFRALLICWKCREGHSLSQQDADAATLKITGHDVEFLVGVHICGCQPPNSFASHKR
jgi:hypothetical protein